MIAKTYTARPRRELPTRMTSSTSTPSKPQIALLEAFERGRTRVMPYVLAASDVGVRDFADVRREDAVEAEFMTLLDRIGLPAFQRHVVESSGRRAP